MLDGSEGRVGVVLGFVYWRVLGDLGSGVLGRGWGEVFSVLGRWSVFRDLKIRFSFCGSSSRVFLFFWF